MADQSNPLLDFLGGLSQGVQEIAAFRQAALGNPAPVQMMQEQQRQRNLLNQLQSMSQGEMQGPFGETLKRQLQFGDVQGAQKTLINLPRYKEIQSALQNPKLGLSPETQSAMASLSALDPELGAKALKEYIGQAEIGKRRKEEISQTFQERRTLEESKRIRQEAKLPGNIVAAAIENKTVDATDVTGIVGVLQAAGIKLPENENDARIYASRILNSPKIKAMIPKKETKSWADSFTSFFSKKPEAQVPAGPVSPMPTPVAPMQQPTQEQKMQRLMELLQKQGR